MQEPTRQSDANAVDRASTNLETFFDRYRDAWADITADRLLSFWHPHGAVTRAATGEVQTPQDVARQIGVAKMLFPDLRLTPLRWAASDEKTIFIQWTMTATFNGKSVESSGVDVFSVAAGRAETGVSYSDPARLIRQISPETPIPDLFSVLSRMAAASERSASTPC